MSKIKVYLSGSIRNADDDFQNWRKECNSYHEDGFCYNLEFVDPNNYFNYTEKPPETNRQCLDLFMWLVDKCDVLLVNLDNSDRSIGTAMEVEHAFCKGIPIIAFGSEPDTWYNWVYERASVVFDSLEDATDYINYSYGRI